MLSAILDTSSLITLGIAERAISRFHSKGIAEVGNHYRSHYRFFGGIDQAIEAFILYDEIYLDAPSVRRNTDKLPELQNYSSFCQLVGEEEEAENKIYQAILRDYVPHIHVETEQFVNVYRMHTEDWMCREMGISRIFPSAGWRNIESKLTDDAKQVAKSMREQIGKYTPNSGAALVQLIRMMYYDYLQQIYHLDLILHPLKANFRKEEIRSGLNILDMFDDSVRKAFYERKQKWLGNKDLSVNIPILTSFILNKCKDKSDLPKIIQEVRESKSATAFRHGLNELLTAASEHNNQEVDEVLAQLQEAVSQWNTKLGTSTPTKKIRVSVPFVGISTELEIPYKKLGKSTGDRLLVFVHEILAGA